MCQGVTSDFDLTEHLYEGDDDSSNDMHTINSHKHLCNTSHKISSMHVMVKESNRSDASLKAYENIQYNSKDILHAHKNTCASKLHITPFNNICSLRDYKSTNETSKVIQQTRKNVLNISIKFPFAHESHNTLRKTFEDPESVRNISKEILPMCITCQLPFNDQCALECHECEYDSSEEISQTSGCVHTNSKRIPPKYITCQRPFIYHGLEGYQSSNILQSPGNAYSTSKNILQAHETKSYRSKGILSLCFSCQKPYDNFCAVQGHKCIHKPSRKHSEGHTDKQDSSKTVSCELCQKTFGKRSALMRHLLIHTGERPYICNMCKSTFAKKINLDRHQLKHSGIKPFYCEICHRAFQTKQHLDQHHLVHTGERPYECSVCQKTYSQKSNLNRHLITHIEKKPYFCNICQNGFAQKPHLLRHLRVHTGEKPFECDVCQKSFAERSSLYRHIVIHTNERSFTCSICPKAFKRKSHLDQHVKTHKKSVQAQSNLKESHSIFSS